MSAVTIIKNIFQFAKILISAADDQVGEWDETSVQNALAWAEYCKELFNNIKGQDYEMAVDSQLQQMTVLLKPISCLTLSVNSLGRAETLLVEMLLSNPNFTKGCRTKLINFLQGRKEHRMVLEEVQQKLERITTHVNVCRDVLEILGNTQISSDVNEILHDTKASCQARTLLQHLMIFASDSRKPERFHSYCHGLCDQLYDTQEGQAILVRCFCVDASLVSSTQAASMEVIQAQFMSWLSHRLKADRHPCFLENISLDLVMRACSLNDKFFHLYLTSLTDWAESFSPCINTEGLVVWRSSMGHSLMDLCMPFHRLLTPSQLASPGKRSAVLRRITDKIKTEDFTVWQELAKELLHVLPRG